MAGRERLSTGNPTRDRAAARSVFMSAFRLVVATVIVAMLAAACSPTAPPTGSALAAPPSNASPSPAGTTAPSVPTTPAPAAATAFSAPEGASRAGRLRLTTTLSADGIPVTDVPISVTTTALDATYQVIELKGVVPGPAESVIVGFRFNQEGAGPAPIDLKVYRITYADGGRRKNQLPNASFGSGFYLWAVYGTGRSTTPHSDRDDGRMLRLRASTDEDIAINSFGIPAKPKSTFRLTVEAMLPPAGSVTGYASPIFILDTEVQRQTLDLVAPPIPALVLTTDAAGAVTIDRALPAGRYLVRVSYAGDSAHESTVVEQEVTVR
jgi:hypothetical protein